MNEWDAELDLVERFHGGSESCCRFLVSLGKCSRDGAYDEQSRDSFHSCVCI